jgi:hypothetical protein
MVEENEITGSVLGAAIEVHRHLGPGLPEAEGAVIVERKAMEELLPIHKSQLPTPAIPGSPRDLSVLRVSALNRKVQKVQ